MSSKLLEIIGPSPLLYTVKKVRTKLFFRGGSQEEICPFDSQFFDEMRELTFENFPEKKKPRRLTERELREIRAAKNKYSLTPEQRLVKSVLEDAKVKGVIDQQCFLNVEEMYEFRRKYKNYLRLKRFIPLGIVSRFTTNELSKMAYAAALGSKSVSLTLPGLIGYSLPCFFFFHMTGFYAPDKLKPVCQVGKFVLGGPFWLICTTIDGVTAGIEEKLFGTEVPLDIVETGGTIPGELGDFDKLREILDEFSNDFSKKTYK